jgi:hypothetical protein
MENVNKTGKRMEPIVRDSKGRWVQGSGSPSPGRPVSSRQRIAESLLKDLETVWTEDFGDGTSTGLMVLRRLARDDPKAFSQIGYGLLPRDVFVQVQTQDAVIPPEDRALLVDLLRTIRDAVPADAETTPVLEYVSDVLRAKYAKPVNSAQDE